MVKILFTQARLSISTIEGNKIIISFTNTGSGLITNDGEEPSEFAIAGADKKFVWAKAKIEGDKIMFGMMIFLIQCMYGMHGPIILLIQICITKKDYRHHHSELINI